MDSVCSAWAYAKLKNIIDKDNSYVPVMLGPANRNTRRAFSDMGLDLPRFIHDVRARVGEVARKPTYTMESSDPVYLLMDLFARMKPTVVPVLDNGEYKGLLSADDINAFFLRESVNGSRQSYLISERNIERVIKGAFLKRNGLDVRAPYMVGAMEYQVFLSRLGRCREKPVLIIGDRRKHLEAAIDAQLPGIVLTGIENLDEFDFDFTSFDGFVYLSALDTAETLRLMRLSTPISDILNPDDEFSVEADDLFDDAKKKLSESERRGMSVYEKGKWTGFVTRRCFLDKPHQRLILVDHNEAAQSVTGVEEAEIVEIIDHHRLAAPRMRNPIYISSEPLGSTCTIVYEQYRKWEVDIDAVTARVLLSGLLADTVILKSPTTTAFDIHVAGKLARIAGLDIQEYGNRLFSDDLGLAAQDPKAVIASDMKRYKEKNISFAISQVEVTNLTEIKQIKDKYLEALENERKALELDWAMLLITDVISETSVLLSTDFYELSRLPYERVSKGVYSLPDVLSRKKQLLPEILSMLDEL